MPSEIVEAEYVYERADGVPACTVIRYRPKRFEVFDAGGNLVPGIPEPAVLYRLPELQRAKRSATVFIVEGEKDVETLRGLDLVATSNPGGTRQGWRAAYTSELAGRHVAILADRDGPGQRHAHAVRKQLQGVARSALIVSLPRLRPPEDVTDWLERRSGSAAELLGLVAAARLNRAGIRGRPNVNTLARLVLRAPLEAPEKLALLAILHAGDGNAAHDARSVGALAKEISMHRVTVQNMLTSLEDLGVLTRVADGRAIAWDVLATLER